MATWCRWDATGVTLQLHVQPRAKRTGAAGMHGERLKLRVAAPPVDGAANAAVEAWVAKAAEVAKSRVTIVRGEASREKEVRVACDAPEEVARRLIDLCS